MRRVFLRAMTAVVALGLAAGCDGGTSAPPREDFTKKQLSRAVLEKAALDGSSRFKVMQIPQKEFRKLSVDPSSRCGPLRLAIGHTTVPRAEVRTTELVWPGDSTGPLQVSLLAHRYDDARAVMKGLRATLAHCRTYRDEEGDTDEVTRLHARFGDESVAFTVELAADSPATVMARIMFRFVVVRAGSVVVFVSRLDSQAGGARFIASADTVLRAQLDKLARTA
ncbi:hypothetical protein ACIPWY_17165 [Streptomyces sp. NPDC090032]|uniref:hypothetical protein n=1 Tax=Streptomyces sp. NPDC090032 TaxID=3365925 RepID=UPI0037F556C3